METPNTGISGGLVLILDTRTTDYHAGQFSGSVGFMVCAFFLW